MIKDFLKHSFIYTVGTVLTRGISIFLVPIYTHYLTPTEYGMLDYFMILASIINLTIALEISQAVVRFYQDVNTSYEKKQYVSTAFIFTLIVNILYFVISTIFALPLSNLFLDTSNMSILFSIASAAIASNGIFYFVQNQLKFQIKPKEFTVVSITNVLILASIAIYLLVYREMKVESIFIAQCIANITSSILAIYLSKENYGVIFIYSKFKAMITFSAPLVLSGIAVFISLYIDRIAIKSLVGLEALGVYAIAYKFASIAGLVMIGFQSSLMPLIYQHYKEAKTPDEISKIFNIFVLFALFVIAGSIVFSKEIIILLTTEAFFEASNLISMLVMTVFFSNMYIFAPGIGIAKKTKVTAIIMICSAILNTIFSYTLIPIIGISGAAFAALISAAITFFLYAKLSYKYYPIPYKTKQLFLSFIFVLLSGYIINNLFTEITIISIATKIAYIIVVIFAISFLLIEKEFLKKLITKLTRII